MRIRGMVGEVFGKCLVSQWIKSFQKKVEKFHIQYSGIQFLKELEGQSYLLVANHLKPDAKVSLETGLSPDALVMIRVVLEQTGRQLRMIAKSDNGWWSESARFRLWQKICQPFGDGMTKGMGMIPIRKNPGSSNRYFLKLVESTVKKREPIFIFPESYWYQDFSREHQLGTGVAHLALKHNLPIVPAYIRGCHSWEQQGRIDLAFGESFQPTGKTKEEITTEIRERIASLQNQTIQ